MFRYDMTQNASSPYAGGAIKAGEVIGLSATGAPIKFGSTAVGAPIGVAQSDAADKGRVEYAKGQVAMLFPAGATQGQIACVSAAGAVTGEDAPVGAYALGVVLTTCVAGGKAVVAFDVDVIPVPAGN